MLATFKKGGVHPDDKKSLSKDVPVKVIGFDSELSVSMSQHLGAPAVLQKQIGDHVLKGELIGLSSGFISANVHSPVSGTITSIVKTLLANGVSADSVVIKPDETETVTFDERVDYSSFDKNKLLEIVKSSGIVGQGGATFPTGVKLTVSEGKTVDALVINCVECEPYLTSDYRLMLEKPQELLEGVYICSKILSPKRVIIGIENNKRDAAALLEKTIEQMGYDFEVKLLKMKYPQGDEKQLLKATINREIPSGKLPIDVGGVVVNASSAWSVFKAVAFGKPCIERIVTVSGECIKNPCNYLVPIGTRISSLIDAAGGFKEEPDKIISGGPMMGFAFFDENTPVTKGTSGIIAIKDRKRNQTACLSCGKCVVSCPIGLVPTKLYALITNGKYEEAIKNNLMDCKECGCCAYSCPANLDLVQAFKTGKKLGRKK